ncbi:hypothetical protein MBLNU459_g6245t1 [Dothideomycetes sp. NU459]
MVVLRKRKTPPPAPAPAPKKERKTKAKATNGTASTEAAAASTEAAAAPAPAPEPEPEAEEPKVEAPAAAPEKKAAPSGPPKNNDKVDLDGFGGEVETHDGKKVTLKSLVEESKAGVVLFTYPKASTPGCTTQACIFRDTYESLTATGLSIYGLSTDSPKANTTFKTNKKLPYSLLCDPAASLIGAIGLKKSPKGTVRGVFVIGKDGTVLSTGPGNPAGTVEMVKVVLKEMGGSAGDGVGEDGDKKAAETADEVADTAEKLENGKLDK